MKRTPASENEDVRSLLDRLGLAPPDADLPFLQRTLLRQREALRVIEAQVHPHTEPAHVFRPLAAKDESAAGEDAPVKTTGAQ